MGPYGSACIYQFVYKLILNNKLKTGFLFVYVKDNKTNSTEEFIKTEGLWISLSTGKDARDLKIKKRNKRHL